MKVTILDDYFDTVRTLNCFAKLKDHDVKIWNDHAQDTDTLAERLRDTSLRELVTTNSVPVPTLEGCPITVCSVASLLGEGIKRIHDDESVTSLFEINGQSA